MNLYLFDLDETLVGIGHIHKEAYEGMMNAVYGYRGRFEDGKGPGRNAHTIIYDMMANLKKEEVDAKKYEAVKMLASHLIKNVHEGHVFPGVKELLRRLSNGNKVALYTGGSEPVTNAILLRTGLKDYLDFAVSAQPGEERKDFLARAIKKAKAKFGKFEKIYAIGDTTHDIAAAKANGIISVAVGTGVQPRETVLREKPDLFFDDLHDFENIIRVIG